MEGACGRVRSGRGRRVSAALPRPDEAGRRGGRATERWTPEQRSGMSAYAPEETSASSEMKWARSTARKAACVPRYHASLSGAGAARTGKKRGRSEARAAAPQRRSCGWCRSETSCARARRLVRGSGAIGTIPCFSCRAVGGAQTAICCNPTLPLLLLERASDSEPPPPRNHHPTTHMMNKTLY